MTKSYISIVTENGVVLISESQNWTTVRLLNANQQRQLTAGTKLIYKVLKNLDQLISIYFATYFYQN